MKDCKRARNTVLAAVAFWLTALPAVTVQAQREGSRPVPVDRRIAETNRQNEQLERDQLSRALEEKDEPRGTPKPSQAVVTQVMKDFDQIQNVNREMVRSLAAARLDYKFVSEATTEIKRCATRLKSNLALPRTGEKADEKRRELNEEQMKQSLTALSNFIVSFVTNPLFETSVALDVELSTKASRDLEQIIELSESLRKSAEKLGKLRR